MLTLLNNQPYEELVDAINDKAQTSGVHNIDELISLIDGMSVDAYPPVESPTIIDNIQVGISNININIAKFTDYPATLKINNVTQNLSMGNTIIILNANENYTLEFSNIFDLFIRNMSVPNPQANPINITIGYFKYLFINNMVSTITSGGANYTINATAPDVAINECNSFTFNTVSEYVAGFTINYINSAVYIINIPEGLKYLYMLTVNNIQNSTLMMPYTLENFIELSSGAYANIQNIVIGDAINGSNIKSISPQAFIATSSGTSAVTGSYVRIFAQTPPTVVMRYSASLTECYQYETLEIPNGTYSAYNGSAFANMFPNATIVEM